MTIIESALQRTKARKAAARPADVTPDSGAVHEQAARSDPGAIPAAQPPFPGPAQPSVAVPPATQIHPTPMSVELRAAREQRVLFARSRATDRGVMAAYGMLRTRLLQRMRANRWTTIGVTSATPHDGKSLTSLNLALSLAREKNSFVVLLDLDLCKPSLSDYLGITPRVELAEFFVNKSREADDLFMSIGVENLIFAGSSRPTEHSAELLASGRLEELLQFIRKYTLNPLILIDLPPLLSPDDALVVAPRIDALLIVSSEGVTPRAELQRALALASSFPIAGLVLNRSTDMPHGYAYGYGSDQGGSRR